MFILNPIFKMICRPRNNIFKQFLLDNGFLSTQGKKNGNIFKMRVSNEIKFLEIYEKNR